MWHSPLFGKMLSTTNWSLTHSPHRLGVFLTLIDVRIGSCNGVGDLWIADGCNAFELVKLSEGWPLSSTDWGTPVPGINNIGPSSIITWNRRRQNITILPTTPTTPLLHSRIKRLHNTLWFRRWIFRIWLVFWNMLNISSNFSWTLKSSWGLWDRQFAWNNTK